MPPTEPQLRRILLALDAAGPSPAAMSLAVSLAARLQAELDTMLLTPAELTRAAALPFTTEISLLAGMERRLSTPLIERSLQGLVERVRATMRQLADPARIHWSLQLGAWAEWEGMLAQPLAGSLFVLRSAAERASGQLPRGATASEGVCVVHGDDPAGQAALDIARALDPTATCLAIDREGLSTPGTIDPTVARLLGCLSRLRPQTVVLPASWYGTRATQLRPVLSRVECNLVIVG